jgi:hypothetical protein
MRGVVAELRIDLGVGILVQVHIAGQIVVRREIDQPGVDEGGRQGDRPSPIRAIVQSSEPLADQRGA